MPQECRGVIEHDDVEQRARHDTAESRRQLPKRTPPLLICQSLLEEHRDVDVAVGARASMGATPEQKGEPNSRNVGERLA